MNHSQRREEKKRRRQKRLTKRSQAIRTLDQMVDKLRELSKIALPASYPGATDLSLERPDRVKFALANFAYEGAGGEQGRRFERQVQQGILGDFPDIDHWCMEEFLWHGAPGGDGNPVDQFLAKSASQFPPAARQQLALWKQARIGLYEIGDLANDLILLRELDPVTLAPAAAWLRAVALNMGGVNQFARQQGLIILTYVAPWAPAEAVHCAMGYGLSLPRDRCPLAAPLIMGLRDAKTLVFPLPWKAGPAAHREFLAEWRRREWYAWMKERVRLPFFAAVTLGLEETKMVKIEDLVTGSAEEARRMGLYFAGQLDATQVGVLGATNLTPIDVGSSTALALAEYEEYRRLAGPPPATRDR